MSIELLFASGLIVFALISLLFKAERAVGVHCSAMRTVMVRAGRDFERTHPRLCGVEDSFYVFFHKDSFTLK